MSPPKIFSRIRGIAGQKRAETVSYDELFKGKAITPPAGANWLPGLRPVEYDVDSYFKEVFAGPVF